MFHLLCHDEVEDAPDDSPGVVHVQVDLLPEFHRVKLLCAEDDVPGAVLDVVPGHVAELEIVGPCQDTLDRPLGQLAGVVLQLVGQHGATLSVQLLPPVDLREKCLLSTAGDL